MHILAKIIVAAVAVVASGPAVAGFAGPATPLVSTSAATAAAKFGRRQHAAVSTRMQVGGMGEDDIRKLTDLATSTLASLARGPPGVFVSGYRAELSQTYQNPTADLPVREYSESLPSVRPAMPLELYEFEACPFCRKVREALTMLDLDAIIYPCPGGGDRYRPKVLDMGGKTQFPYFKDPNTRFEAYESDAIVKYLFQTYGDGIIPLELSLGPLTTLSCAGVSALRPGKGSKSRASGASPDQPLELWGYESAPPVRLVREVLCELEIPYKSVTAARGSKKAVELKETEGKFQVPFLRDANTGMSMFESADIIKYLEDTYGPSAPPRKAGEGMKKDGDAAEVKKAGEPGWEDEVEDATVAAKDAAVTPEKEVTVEAKLVEEPVEEDTAVDAGAKPINLAKQNARKANKKQWGIKKPLKP